MNSCPLWDCSPIKSWQRDSFWLITFWLAWLTLALLIQEANVPICLGKYHQRSSFCFFLCCDLVFQRPVGIRLGTADIVSPRGKFVRLSQIYLCQILQCHWVIHTWKLLILNCNCLTLHVGDLEGTDWWMASSFWFLRQKKEKQKFPLFFQEGKAWSGGCSLLLHPCLFSFRLG